MALLKDEGLGPSQEVCICTDSTAVNRPITAPHMVMTNANVQEACATLGVRQSKVDEYAWPRKLATYLCTHSSQSLNSSGHSRGKPDLAFRSRGCISQVTKIFYLFSSALRFAFVVACAQKTSHVAKIVLVPKRVSCNLEPDISSSPHTPYIIHQRFSYINTCLTQGQST